MSINWVMLDNSMKDFVRLPREKILFTSPSRTALSLQSPNSFPGKEPLNIKCNDGRAIITNQRIVYLPAKPTPVFQSFQSPILSLQDTHVSAPWFGPNVWEGVLIPTPGGGIQPHHNLVQAKLTFQEGGAFDFSSIYERIKESASQAADIARESGRVLQEGEIDLEQLPAYEEAASSTSAVSAPALATVTASAGTSTGSVQRPMPIHPNGVPGSSTATNGGDSRAAKPDPTRDQPIPPPDGPPPGYDEVPNNSVVNGLENRVKESG